jgi:AcrR family transcriptional regulator
MRSFLIVGRRTVDETRQLLLETGLRILQQRGVHVGVAHIRLSDVAHEAGYTTGAGYRCWKDQAAFHRDLAIAAVRRRNEDPIAGTVRRIRDLVDARAPLAEVIRVAAEANLHGEPDEAVAEAARDHVTTTIESFVALFGLLLEVYGLRMRPPYTLVHLVLAVLALSEGFAVQSLAGDPHPRVRRDDIGPAVDGNWSLFGCAAEAVVARFTEPVVGERPTA